MSRTRAEKIAVLCLRVAEQAERELVLVYDMIDETQCRVPQLEATLLRVHQELVKLRQCATVAAICQTRNGVF